MTSAVASTPTRTAGRIRGWLSVRRSLAAEVAAVLALYGLYELRVDSSSDDAAGAMVAALAAAAALLLIRSSAPGRLVRLPGRPSPDWAREELAA